MNLATTASKLKQGQTALGIELGSTRIKAVLVTDDYQVVASGDFVWENELHDNIWTWGSAKDAPELVRNACGAPFDATFYCDYLASKFSELYNL